MARRSSLRQTRKVTRPPRIGLVSLGCPKALVDSERILTRLRAEGYTLSSSYQGADVVLVNTCGFLDSARQESLASIGEALAENGRVIVTGCLGVDPEAIQRVHPQVLAITGTGPSQYDSVLAAIHKSVPPPRTASQRLLPPQGLRLTPAHFAYLKIAEGCHNRCSFCIIPDLRGDLISRPAGDVLAEAEALVAGGVRELVVIAQDLGAYGRDFGHTESAWHGRPVAARLDSLVEALAELGVWVRLMYVYPYPSIDCLIPLMIQADGSPRRGGRAGAGEGTFGGGLLPYLDMPFQHASPRILKAMRRPAGEDKTLERIKSWRALCPDLTLRSSFIVGFPGETEEDFQDLLDWLSEAQLDRVGCFRFEPVPGAAANDLPDPVPEAVTDERWHRLMQHQQQISAQRLKRWVGRRIAVLVEEIDEHGQASGRSMGDAPEIDGKVYIEGAAGTPIGTIGTVLVKRTEDYDLWGAFDQGNTLQPIPEDA